MHKGGKYTQLKTADTWDLQHPGVLLQNSGTQTWNLIPLDFLNLFLHLNTYISPDIMKLNLKNTWDVSRFHAQPVFL